MKKSVVREYFESLVIAVVLALFVRTFVFQAFKIPTGSMEPNLLIGDHLIVNKMVFAPAATGIERAILPSRTIRRGDIIVFKYPEGARARFHQARDRPAGRPARAAPQEDLHQRQAARRAVRALHQPPSPDGAPRTDDLREEYGPVTVPAGQYFMMGDNRDNSRGQPLLGLPAAVLRQGPGAVHLFLGRRTASSARRHPVEPAADRVR